MIEITNKQPGPIQLVVRSHRRAKGFTTLIVPGRGKGKNVVFIEDEDNTEYVDRAEKVFGLISTRQVANKGEGKCR